jgi:hypothetical protein
MTEVPTYVTEFQRWHAAAGSQKRGIAIQQAMTNIDTGPDYGDVPNIFDVITPCGKCLGACVKGDLEAMARWYREVGEASKLFADVCNEELADRARRTRAHKK